MFDAFTGTFAANKVLRELGKSGAVGRTENTVLFPLAEIKTEEFDGQVAPLWVAETVPFVPVEGRSYKVSLNSGASNFEYECTATKLEEDGYVVIMIGNSGIVGFGEDTGEHILVSYEKDSEGYENFTVFTKYPCTATLTISTETIHPINPKYLPEGGAGYSESWSITWDGNTEGRETFGIPDGETWYHVSDKVLTADDFYGAMATVLIPVDVESSPESILGTSDNVFELLPGAVSLTGVVYSFAQAGEVDEGIVVPKVGTYFLKAVDARVTSLSKEEVHPIESKYIPGVVLPKVTLYEGSAFYGSDPSTLDFPALTEAHNKGVPCVICNNSGSVSVVANRIANGFVMLVGGEVITFTRSSTDEWSTSSRSY